MSDDSIRPKLEAVPLTEEELDEEEREFRTLRRDLPGVKGASAAGIVAISVGKAPGKNEFFRTHPEFRADRPHGRCRGGDGEALLRGDADMIEPLASIGIYGCRSRALSDHHLARCGEDRSGTSSQH